MPLSTIPQVLIICLGPFLILQILKRSNVNKWLSPVVLCYGIGILIANLHLFPIHQNMSTAFSQGTILLAIPLLLYATDFMAWFRHSRSTIVGFSLSIISTIIAAVIMAFFFQPEFASPWMVSGMLVGVFSGGTPNMQAVGIALGADEEVYVLLNAADIFCGGIYLLFLTSIAHRLLGYLLPKYQGNETALSIGTQETEQTSIPWLAFLLTILIVLSSVGLTFLTPGGLTNSGILILLLTTFSILASFSEKVRNWKGTYESGEYLLFMFCIAVGMLSDFSSLLEEGGEVVAYMASVLGLTILLHLIFCRLFKIDRDTAMITSTAAVYGPVFVGQVASAIGNRQLVLAGIACGLVGIALGNYLGISIAWLLRYLMI